MAFYPSDYHISSIWLLFIVGLLCSYIKSHVVLRKSPTILRQSNNYRNFDSRKLNFSQSCVDNIQKK